MKELELETKFGKRKIELVSSEENICSGCVYERMCDITDISFLEIAGSSRYNKDTGDKYYKNINYICTYVIGLSYRPAPGTLEKNIPEIFPETLMKNDINNYCNSQCIFKCIGSNCILNKWRDVNEEKEKV